MEKRIQWKQVLLWHMLAHVVAGVLVLVTTVRALELQMESRLHLTLKLQLRRFRVKEHYCYLLKTEFLQSSKALLNAVKPYCIIRMR